MSKMLTKLQSGVTVPKNSPVLHAAGTIEELNANLGVVLAYIWENADAMEVLMEVQKDLIVVVNDLQNPGVLDYQGLQNKKFRYIKEKNEMFAKLLIEPKDIIPGGTPASAHCHLARAVCRRAERAIAELAFSEQHFVNGNIGLYLNSLDKLLFSLARLFNPSDNFLEQDETGTESTTLGTIEVPQ